MRGRASEEGDTRVSANGYHYTRTKTEWILTHQLIMEKKLGRKLRAGERVRFIDGKRTNLDPKNLEISNATRGSLNRRKVNLEARIKDLQDEIEDVTKELRKLG